MKLGTDDWSSWQKKIVTNLPFGTNKNIMLCNNVVNTFVLKTCTNQIIMNLFTTTARALLCNEVAV